MTDLIHTSFETLDADGTLETFGSKYVKAGKVVEAINKLRFKDGYVIRDTETVCDAPNKYINKLPKHHSGRTGIDKSLELDLKDGDGFRCVVKVMEDGKGISMHMIDKIVKRLGEDCLVSMYFETLLWDYESSNTVAVLVIDCNKLKSSFIETELHVDNRKK
jgi:hypothetical protein